LASRCEVLVACVTHGLALGRAIAGVEGRHRALELVAAARLLAERARQRARSRECPRHAVDRPLERRVEGRRFRRQVGIQRVVVGAVVVAIVVGLARATLGHCAAAREERL
jgi:hypothetical protein